MSEETGFDQMAEDLFNAIGIDATFVPKIGDAVALKVNYDQTVDYHPDGYAGTFQGYLRTVEFIYTDIGKLPVKGDYFLIGTTRFEVQRILDHEGAGRFVKAVVI
jgi:hypothetical protein